ncbi:MAG: hypothetical protein EBR30_08420 [Cytophagia bacterium]|jgi:hypothetical protein|nr:hypothetical protein [Cytophagia bacterium]
MKQVFTHYEKWEDFQAGMYSLLDIVDKDKKVIGAINLLSNENDFYIASKQVLENWKIATEVNFTNKQQNRRAWLGAAACMYVHNTPEYLTRIAWNLLNKDIQDRANLIAEKVINEYINKKNNVQTLF